MLRKDLIERTRLLYRWDRFNTVNIHRYIDNHPNIVLLIQTEKDYCIGAYSQAPFKTQTISNQPGLLISFNNQMIFKNNKKAIIYDES